MSNELTTDNRAFMLAVEDTQLIKRADREIADEWGVCTKTLQRLRQSEGYKQQLQEIIQPDGLLSTRIRLKTEDIFVAGLERLEALICDEHVRAETLVQALKFLSKLLPDTGASPSEPLPAHFRPATVLIQNATFIREEIVNVAPTEESP